MHPYFIAAGYVALAVVFAVLAAKLSRHGRENNQKPVLVMAVFEQAMAISMACTATWYLMIDHLGLAGYHLITGILNLATGFAAMSAMIALTMSSLRSSSRSLMKGTAVTGFVVWSVLLFFDYDWLYMRWFLVGAYGLCLPLNLARKDQPDRLSVFWGLLLIMFVESRIITNYDIGIEDNPFLMTQFLLVGVAFLMYTGGKHLKDANLQA